MLKINKIILITEKRQIAARSCGEMYCSGDVCVEMRGGKVNVRGGL